MKKPRSSRFETLNRLVVFLALAAALSLGLAACAPAPAPGPARPALTVQQEISALLNLGDERVQKRMYAEAGDAYLAALKMNPGPPEKARALLGLAQCYQLSGDQRRALVWAQQLIDELPGSSLAPQAELTAARAEMALDLPDQAVPRLRRVLAAPASQLSPMVRAEAQALMAKALEQSGSPEQALRALLDAARDAGASPELEDRLAQNAAQMPSQRLEPYLAGRLEPGVRTALLVGLAGSLLREGRLDEATRMVQDLRRQPGVDRWQDKLSALSAQLSQAKVVNPRAVGVVLPLSGPYQNHGRRVLAAVELGLGLFGAQSASPITLHIDDSRNSPEAAAEAVSRLVQDQRVIAIIGPMGAATSLSAARRAQLLGVPLITLTQVEGVTQAGPFVFQNSFTPAEQVETLLNEEMGVRGGRRMAILAPRNSYGEGFARLFSAQVAERGGQVVRTVFYDPASNDFTNDIKSLVRLPPGSYRPGLPDSPKPVIDFEAVFIPDGPERAGMVVSQLAYFDVNNVDLLGTSLWRNPSLISIAGRYLARAMFPSAFDPRSPDSMVRGFVREFSLAMGGEPNALDAHGYDAALLARHLLDQTQPPRTRQAFRQDLSGLTGIPGVCGVMRVDADGRVQKALKLYTVSKGAFMPLEQAPLPGPEPEAGTSPEVTEPTAQAPLASPTEMSPAWTGPVSLPAPAGKVLR